jgi:hypothetical protein
MKVILEEYLQAIGLESAEPLAWRYTRLLARRLQRNKAIVAIARELCGFIWELLRTNEDKMSHRANYDRRSRAEKSGHTDGPRLARSNG